MSRLLCCVLDLVQGLTFKFVDYPYHFRNEEKTGFGTGDRDYYAMFWFWSRVRSSLWIILIIFFSFFFFKLTIERLIPYCLCSNSPCTINYMYCVTGHPIKSIFSQFCSYCHRARRQSTQRRPGVPWVFKVKSRYQA